MLLLREFASDFFRPSPAALTPLHQGPRQLLPSGHPGAMASHAACPFNL